MDQRHMPALSRSPVPSSFFLEEIRFPSERQVGFWKTASLPDHYGLDAMSFRSQGQAVSSTPLEMIHPMGGNSVDCLDLPRDLFKDSKRNINFEHHLTRTRGSANCWRSSDQDIASLSKLHGPPASLSVEDKTIALNGGHRENGLFSSSMSDIFNKKYEVFGSLEEIEAQAIGDLLPDDDDLLSEAIHDHVHIAQPNWADVEDDLFCSVGGMELESDDKFSYKKTSEIDNRGAFIGQERGLDKTSATTIPHGGEPTRTLFVKNIGRNIEDIELRVLFEQYGDVETLYTSHRHHGFIMVAYYDIRAAQNAIKVLNTKTIGDQKLDIRFYSSKDSPSEKDIGEAVLLVTNLESSVSDDDLLHIFGVYGEIKEICEIPQNGHHKVIRFYDVRAAEAAFLALNRGDIAGKVMMVEPCGLRDSSFSLVQQLTLDPVEEESSRFRKECRSKNMQSGCFVPSGLITRGADVCTSLQNGAILGMRAAFEMQSSSSVESNFHGISLGIPRNLSSPARVAMAGKCSNQSSSCEHSPSLGRMNHSFQSMLAFPEFRDGVISDIHFNSPSTMSAMAMNISPTLATGFGNKNFRRVGAGNHSSHSFQQNESEFNLSGAAICPSRGHEYIWSSSKTWQHHNPAYMMWKNLPPFMNNLSDQTPQVHGLARGPSHMPNPVLPQHHHVVSAPAANPLLWDDLHTFTGDATTFYTSSLGNMGCSNCSPLHSLELASDNIFASARVGSPLPQQSCHFFRGRNSVNPMHNSYDAPNNRIRRRRCDVSAGQADSRKQFELDIDHIIHGEDLRTTLMIKNIPNKYTSKMLLATIDEQHKGTYDFIYLPIDFKNKCNVGYAFINMTDPRHIIPLYKVFNGKKWEKFNSEKVAYLAYARIQGKAALTAHFQNSSLMNEDKRCRPILFHSDGPNAGDQEPFPIPADVNIRSRRSRSIEIQQGCISGSSSEEESSIAIGSSNSTKHFE